MDCPEKEVRVFYNRPERINQDYDDALENALFAFGLKRWASGFDFTTGTRDLAFRIETEEERKEIHG